MTSLADEPKKPKKKAKKPVKRNASNKIPRKTGKRHGNVAGLTKETNPKLANRLPRERGAIVASVGDGMTPFERVLMILGKRVKVTKDCYLLDGKPCNATDLFVAAGISM